MIQLFTEETFAKTKSRSLLPLKCEFCSLTFYVTKHIIQKALNPNDARSGQFCSPGCQGKNKTVIGTEIVQCKMCSKIFTKHNSQIKPFSNNFCSCSCSAIYNNRNKLTGTRRSKLEVWLEQGLNNLYPQLEIMYNSRIIEGVEFDIYIPTIKLSFKINGIFHYKPIFGKDKLAKIQYNDTNKSLICKKNKINFYTINTSKQINFNISTSEKYLKEIIIIINDYLSTSK